jgi:hypothetical protein
MELFSFNKSLFFNFHSKEPKFSKYGCYQSKDSKLSESEIKDKFSDFGVLKWFLTNRLSTCLRKNWIKKKESLEKVEKLSNMFLGPDSDETIDLTIESSKKEIKNDNALSMFNKELELGEYENIFGIFFDLIFFSKWKHLYWNCFLFEQENCNLFK